MTTATTPLIELRGVGKRFTRKKVTTTALEDINLTVRRGEILTIVGQSGAGKSTLLRLLNRLETPTEGSVIVDGTDLAGLNAKQVRALRSRTGMVFQGFNLLSSRTVVGNVAYPLEVAGVPKAEREARVAELLSFVGLLERAWSYPDELSGGQKQRVGIARALATSPEVLLADECTSALDPGTTAEVLALLRRVNDELGITVVAITHEMDVVRELADSVAVLQDGRLVEHGTVDQVLTRPASEPARLLVQATVPIAPKPDDVEAWRAAGEWTVTVDLHDQDAAAKVLATSGVHARLAHAGTTRVKHATLGSATWALRGPAGDVEPVVEAVRAACLSDVTVHQPHTAEAQAVAA